MIAEIDEGHCFSSGGCGTQEGHHQRKTPAAAGTHDLQELTADKPLWEEPCESGEVDGEGFLCCRCRALLEQLAVQMEVRSLDGMLAVTGEESMWFLIDALEVQRRKIEDAIARDLFLEATGFEAGRPFG